MALALDRRERQKSKGLQLDNCQGYTAVADDILAIRRCRELIGVGVWALMLVEHNKLYPQMYSPGTGWDSEEISWFLVRLSPAKVERSPV